MEPSIKMTVRLNQAEIGFLLCALDIASTTAHVENASVYADLLRKVKYNLAGIDQAQSTAKTS